MSTRFLSIARAADVELAARELSPRFTNPATGVVTDRTAQMGAAGGVGGRIVGFGEDGRARVNIVHRSGEIYRIVPEDPACSDGVDNDGDGRIDFPADPNCSSAASTSEYPGCGIGPELAALLPMLMALRRRRTPLARATE